MVQATEHCHIVTDDQILNGEPIIKGTRNPPVRAVVEVWRLGVPGRGNSQPSALTSRQRKCLMRLAITAIIKRRLTFTLPATGFQTR